MNARMLILRLLFLGCFLCGVGILFGNHQKAAADNKSSPLMAVTKKTADENLLLLVFTRAAESQKYQLLSWVKIPARRSFGEYVSNADIKLVTVGDYDIGKQNETLLAVKIFISLSNGSEVEAAMVSDTTILLPQVGDLKIFAGMGKDMNGLLDIYCAIYHVAEISSSDDFFKDIHIKFDKALQERLPLESLPRNDKTGQDVPLDARNSTVLSR